MGQHEIEAVCERLGAFPRPTSLDERRGCVEGLGSTYPISDDVTLTSVEVGGVQAEWTEAPGAETDRVLVFLHGGGYITGSIASHRHLAVELGRVTRMRTFAPQYRLAPEHPFPAALDDVVAAYEFLLEDGIDPEKIAMAGDSAGGGLALASLVALRDRSVPLPGCLWCGSPWIDLSN